MPIFKELIRLEEEAAHFGFYWKNHRQIIQQIQSECLEIEANLKNVAMDADDSQLQEEIGDLLHVVFSLCVFCQFDPRETLQKAVKKFGRRFNMVKQIAHAEGFTTLHGYSFDALMRIWEQAKTRTVSQRDYD